MEGYISRILSSSAVDGPGNRMVIFLQGCNFNCSYCHNPETINRCCDCGECVSSCPAKALALNGETISYDQDKCVQCDTCIKICSYESDPRVQVLTVENVISKIDKVRPFISGVTVSGGECTTQFEFLLSLSKALHEEKISLYIDTNGHIESDKLLVLSNYVDKFMLDVKAVDNNEHINLTGVENHLVLNNFEILAKANKLYEVRSVIVPEILNNEVTVDYVSKVMNKYDSTVRYKLIKYRNYGVRKHYSELLKMPVDDIMDNLKVIAEKNGLKNVIIT